MEDVTVLSDVELARRLQELVLKEKVDLACLLRHLMEFDRRRVHLDLGYPSLYAYCTQALGLSEAASYRRIRAARIARALPQVLDLLASGELHLEAIALLSPYLEDRADAGELLDKARNLRVREVEFLIASLFPRDEVADVVRTLPPAVTAESVSSPHGVSTQDDAIPQSEPLASDDSKKVEEMPCGGTTYIPLVPEPPRLPESIRPLSASRIRFAFTGGLGLLERFQRLRDLMRHKFPTGRLEDLIGEAVEHLLGVKDPDRKQATGRKPPSGDGRRVPQWVRDEVWSRDGGRCSYLGRDGKRCEERGALEFDHRVPWALGGRSNDPRNIRLLCRAHNQHAAREVFGDYWGNWGQAPL